MNAERQPATTTRDSRPLVIRSARPEDKSAIIANINAISQEKIYLIGDEYVPTPAWEAALNGETNAVPLILVVAEVDGQIVGHGRAFPEGFSWKSLHVAEIGLALLKPYRNQGIGGEILANLICETRVVGYEKITAFVFSTNLPSLTLFIKHDFIREGVRKRQYKIQKQYVDEIVFGRVFAK